MKPIYYIALLFILWTSCKKDLRFLELEVDNKPVVNSVFHADSFPQASVTHSLSPQGVIKFETDKNATVNIFQQNEFLGSLNEFILQDTMFNWGVFTNSNINIDNLSGETVQLKVETANGTVTSETKIPPKPLVHDITINDLVVDVQDGWLEETSDINIDAKIHFGIEFIPGEENFYSVSVWAMSTPYYYGWINPVAQEKLHVASNHPAVLKTFYYNEGLIFKQTDFTTDVISLTIDLNDSFLIQETNNPEVFLEIKSIPKDYYEYQLSLYQQMLGEADAFSDPRNVHSNIEGGYGIFAIYNSITYKLTP